MPSTLLRRRDSSSSPVLHHQYSNNNSNNNSPPPNTNVRTTNVQQQNYQQQPAGSGLSLHALSHHNNMMEANIADERLLFNAQQQITFGDSSLGRSAKRKQNITQLNMLKYLPDYYSSNGPAPNQQRISGSSSSPLGNNNNNNNYHVDPVSVSLERDRIRNQITDKNSAASRTSGSKYLERLRNKQRSSSASSKNSSRNPSPADHRQQNSNNSSRAPSPRKKIPQQFDQNQQRNNNNSHNILSELKGNFQLPTALLSQSSRTSSADFGPMMVEQQQQPHNGKKIENKGNSLHTSPTTRRKPTTVINSTENNTYWTRLSHHDPLVAEHMKRVRASLQKETCPFSPKLSSGTKKGSHARLSDQDDVITSGNSSTLNSPMITFLNTNSTLAEGQKKHHPRPASPTPPVQSVYHSLFRGFDPQQQQQQQDNNNISNNGAENATTPGKHGGASPHKIRQGKMRKRNHHNRINNSSPFIIINRAQENEDLQKKNHQMGADDDDDGGGPPPEEEYDGDDNANNNVMTMMNLNNSDQFYDERDGKGNKRQHDIIATKIFNNNHAMHLRAQQQQHANFSIVRKNAALAAAAASTAELGMNSQDDSKSPFHPRISKKSEKILIEIAVREKKQKEEEEARRNQSSKRKGLLAPVTNTNNSKNNNNNKNNNAAASATTNATNPNSAVSAQQQQQQVPLGRDSIKEMFKWQKDKMVKHEKAIETHEKDEKSKLKTECPFQPQLDFHSEYLVYSMGDRRMTAQDQALMTSRQRNSEVIDEMAMRELEKQKDLKYLEQHEKKMTLLTAQEQQQQQHHSSGARSQESSGGNNNNSNGRKQRQPQQQQKSASVPPTKIHDLRKQFIQAVFSM